MCLTLILLQILTSLISAFHLCLPIHWNVTIFFFMFSSTPVPPSLNTYKYFKWLASDAWLLIFTVSELLGFSLAESANLLFYLQIIHTFECLPWNAFCFRYVLQSESLNIRYSYISKQPEKHFPNFILVIFGGGGRCTWVLKSKPGSFFLRFKWHRKPL